MAAVTLDLGGRVELEAVEVDGIGVPVAGDAEEVADVERALQHQFQPVLREVAAEILDARGRHGFLRRLAGVASHTFTVLSSPPDTRCLPSADGKLVAT